MKISTGNFTASPYRGVGPLFGDRPISEFAIELANPLLNDSCFNFVDHIAPELDIRSGRLTPNQN